MRSRISRVKDLSQLSLRVGSGWNEISSVSNDCFEGPGRVYLQVEGEGVRVSSSRGRSDVLKMVEILVVCFVCRGRMS